MITPLITNLKLAVATMVGAIILGTWLYISVLQGRIERKDDIIADQKTVIIVDSKSDVAHALTSELAIEVHKAKGVKNEVEINTTIGTHRYDFK